MTHCIEVVLNLTCS